MVSDRNQAHFPRVVRQLLVAVTLITLDAGSSPTLARPAQVPAPATGAAADEITTAPDFSSSAPSVEIVSVRLATGETGKVVRVRVRNLVDEDVIGYQIEIRGSDPNTSRWTGEVVHRVAERNKAVIGARKLYAIDVDIDNFRPGDKVRLAAVLFGSGRGEGDVIDVDKMRRIASSPPPVVPTAPVPGNAPN